MFIILLSIRKSDIQNSIYNVRLFLKKQKYAIEQLYKREVGERETGRKTERVHLSIKSLEGEIMSIFSSVIFCIFHTISRYVCNLVIKNEITKAI